MNMGFIDNSREVVLDTIDTVHMKLQSGNWSWMLDIDIIEYCNSMQLLRQTVDIVIQSLNRCCMKHQNDVTIISNTLQLVNFMALQGIIISSPSH